MSWIKKSLPSNFCYVRSYIFSYFSNGIHLKQAQHFSSLNSEPKAQLLSCSCQRLERHFSVIEVLKKVQSSLEVFSTQFHNNWVAYIPHYGRVLHRYQGYDWFKTLDEIDIEEFIKVFGMEDTFFTRFNIIELHVWMLLFQLPRDGRINRLVFDGVIEAMWEDAEKRGRLLDHSNPYFRKDFYRLNNKFKVSLLLYDDGYMKSDVILSSALWYNFFNKKYVDPRILEGLVMYIRTQMHKLSQLNFDELRKDDKKTGIWLPPESFVRLRE